MVEELAYSTDEERSQLIEDVLSKERSIEEWKEICLGEPSHGINGVYIPDRVILYPHGADLKDSIVYARIREGYSLRRVLGWIHDHDPREFLLARIMEHEGLTDRVGPGFTCGLIVGASKKPESRVATEA